MTQEVNFKELLRGPGTIFLVVTFLPAWILFLFPLFFRAAGVTGSSLISLAAWSAAMWMPGLGAIIATRYGEKQELKTLGLGKLGNKKIYIWAWLVPILAVIGTGLISMLIGFGKFDPTFQMIRESMEGLPDMPETAIPLVMAVQLVSSLTLAPLFNTVFALGEELGWRGYLLPKLLPLGQIPAVIISGTIWGIWHAPAILQGHNYPKHPVLGVGMMIVFTILMSILFSWLYLKTKSPWAPALAHGTLNAVAGLPLLFLVDVDLTLGGTLTSVSGWLALAFVAGILIIRKEFPLQEGENVSRET